jgi:TctA family transporter
VNSGVARYSLDIAELTDGIGFIVIAMGVFGYGEIISNLSKHESERKIFVASVTGLMPTKEDFKNMVPAVLRGTALGSLLGILPGGGAVMAAFAAYTLEKKTKLRPGEVPFGKGNIRGVAAPEAANNAGSQTSFIPLLTLGIPPNAVMALMVGAMTIHNIQPGPQVMTSNPELFWGLIASMWIGNLMLVILNLPLIGIWIKLLSVPYRWLFPAIVLFCSIGVYSTNNNTFDIWMVAIFGVIGYLFIKLGAEPAPLLLGFCGFFFFGEVGFFDVFAGEVGYAIKEFPFFIYQCEGADAIFAGCFKIVCTKAWCDVHDTGTIFGRYEVA